jgi:uncharacterized protein YndB with AHSA1/START domain
MSARSVTHATFSIERTYDASPRRVFAAFADLAIKTHWFDGPEEWGADEHELDFRAGGRETSRGGPPGGPVHAFEARYYDIVPDQRIVFAYEMHLDERRISVSLATVELEPAGAGTRLTFTEQDAFLDGYDDAGSREQGTRALLDALGATLERQAPGP